MESTGSSATPPRPGRAVPPSHPITDRIFRAIRHRLLLLHRIGATFFVLGATGNVYTISLSSTPSCTCPDRTKPCKHILFVLIKALGVPPDAPCLRRRTLRPCQVDKLLVAPTLRESLAAASLQDRFHKMYRQYKQSQVNGSKSNVIAETEEGATCPVCLEEMERGEKAESCKTCRNWIHEECWLRWRRSKGRRYANCVVCRAKWNSKAEEDKYLNLAAYADASASASASASAPGSDQSATNNSPCQ